VKKLLSLTICLAMVLSLSNFTITVSGDSNFSGSGTEADPFLISSATDLTKLATLTNSGSTAATYVNKYYQLTNDIDMSSVANYVPICYAYEDSTPQNGLGSGKRFNGTLDGNGHIIKNVTINLSTFSDQSKNGMTAGIIGVMGHNPDDDNAGGTVKNLGVENITINTGTKSYPCIGGIAGTMMTRTTITDCYVKVMTVSGTPASAAKCGGIVGALNADTKATLTNNYTRTCTFSISDTSSTGGIFGRGIDASNSGRTVTNCYTTASAKIGGSNTSTIVITNSYGTSQISSITVANLGSAYKNDCFAKQYGYPLLSWEKDLEPNSFTFTLSGSTLTANATVQNYTSASQNVILAIAEYDSASTNELTGFQKQSFPVGASATASKTCTMTKTAGKTYKAFLWSEDNFVALDNAITLNY